MKKLNTFLKFLILLLGLTLAIFSCDNEDVKPEKTEEDRDKISHTEGFKLDYPNATNVIWSKDEELGYNVVSFDLETPDTKLRASEKSTRSTTNTHKAKAFYDDIYINFLTQEFIPPADVPENIIEIARGYAEDEEKVLQAIKATCKGTEFWILRMGTSEDSQSLYTVCNDKLVNYDEWELNKFTIPNIDEMRYIEEKYDNYILLENARTEIEDEYTPFDESGYIVPLYFYDKQFAISEILFVDNKFDRVREMHFLLGGFAGEEKVLPSTVSEVVQTAIHKYITGKGNSLDDVTYSYMYKWCSSERVDEMYHLDLYYGQNQSSEIRIQITPLGVVTEL